MVLSSNLLAYNTVLLDQKHDWDVSADILDDGSVVA